MVESPRALTGLLVLLLAGCSNPPDATQGSAADTSAATTSTELPRAGQATAATAAANASFGERLPLTDQSDFEDARRGFIAAIEAGRITDAQGKVVWDVSAYDFLQQPVPPSVNPSLWRQARLNAIHGLFEVTDGLYQVRGYDIAVMTVIRGTRGWIVIDPLLSRETAAAALDLVQNSLGERPVSAVLFTHSHADHFGGARGVISQQAVASGEIPIVAPAGFTEHAIAENVLAGNAMSRRASFQFANTLKPGVTGPVDTGIGLALSQGTIGLVPPNDTISATGETRSIDGIDFVFIDARGTEAPAEFMFYLPQFRALHTAEVATGTMHNVLTFRGALVRDALAWAKRINDAIDMFADKSDVVLASHNWPTWGTDNVRSYLEHQRDAYRFVHDQTLRLANSGLTMHEIAEQIGEPAFMREDFSVRGYYGTINHNAKATYQRYFGWWDGVPANLNPHPPVAQAQRYVKLAGGAQQMIDNAAQAYADGDYRWVATVMNHLVFAQPEHKTARAYLAGAYEQLGFQAESGMWRNYYLAAAHELREGLNSDQEINLANRDFVNALPTSEYFDALAVRVNPAEAKGGSAVNFIFSDTGEKFGVRIADGVAIHSQHTLYEDAGATVTLARSDLDAIMLGDATFQGKILSGAIDVDGNPLKLIGFLKSHEQFEYWFNVVTP